MGLSDVTFAAPGLLALSGLVLCALGVRIRAGDRYLIAGYDAETVDDPTALGRFVGGGVLTLGVLTLGYAGLGFAVDRGAAYWGSYTALVVVVAVGLPLGARRYADG
jgi:hypothetical protein